MKRLFEVNGEFFDNKMDAKTARGEPTTPETVEKVNGRDVFRPARYKYEVKRGPDHMGKHGVKVPSCSHRAPQVTQPKREGPRVRRSK